MTQKTELVFKLTFLVAFLAVFLIAIFGIANGRAAIGIGIPMLFENYLLIALSLLSIIRLFFSILHH